MVDEVHVVRTISTTSLVKISLFHRRIVIVITGIPVSVMVGVRVIVPILLAITNLVGIGIDLVFVVATEETSVIVHPLVIKTTIGN